MFTVDYIAHNSLSLSFFFNRQHISSTGQTFYLSFNLFFPACWGKDTGESSRMFSWQCFKLQISNVRLILSYVKVQRKWFSPRVMSWLLIISNGVNNHSVLSVFLTSQYSAEQHDIYLCAFCTVSSDHLTFLQLIACKSLSIGTVSVCLSFKAAGKMWET